MAYNHSVAMLMYGISMMCAHLPCDLAHAPFIMKREQLGLSHINPNPKVH